jgi:signal transduction histidine kinase
MDFSASPEVVQVVAEAERLSFGHLFNPTFLERLKSGNAPDEKAVLEIDSRAYQALASPLSLHRDQSGLVIVFRDVTRFRELDEMKTRFVSDVSHELRTPLTNLSLYLDLLAGESNEQKERTLPTTLRRENGPPDSAHRRLRMTGCVRSGTSSLAFPHPPPG